MFIQGILQSQFSLVYHKRSIKGNSWGYIPVRRNLTAMKMKILLRLTTRQLTCFGGGALIGIPLFCLKDHIGAMGCSDA